MKQQYANSQHGSMATTITTMLRFDLHKLDQHQELAILVTIPAQLLSEVVTVGHKLPFQSCPAPRTAQ